MGMGQLRQRLVFNDDRSIPAPLLVMLGVWQGVLFAGFGLLAPRNATTVVVLVVCMISVSGSIFLIMELDRPLRGIVRVSGRSLPLDSLSSGRVTSEPSQGLVVVEGPALEQRTEIFRGPVPGIAWDSLCSIPVKSRGLRAWWSSDF